MGSVEQRSDRSYQTSFHKSALSVTMPASNMPDKLTSKRMQRRGTLIEHLCELRIDDSSQPVFRKTAIICTIGPASREVDTLVQMIKTGMNVARLNFSHGSHEYHAKTISNLREAIAKVGDKRTVALALDTKGPEIRTGILKEGPTAIVELHRGENIMLTTNKDYEEDCNKEMLYVDYKNITKVLSPGMRVFIDDGLISLKVLRLSDESVLCVVENGGNLGSRKGVNLPGCLIDLPAVTAKDKEDLLFAIQQDVDMIFASFARNAPGIREVRKALGDAGTHIKIIAKIENQEGVNNADAIIEEADGIMVARGDLGIEIPAEQVFLVQKTLTAKCNRLGKPVICATQMLESMVEKPRPTRAECSDVANAVLDGVDCVMLSGETAKGEYPIEALQMMHLLCREAESTIVYAKYYEELLRIVKRPTDMAQTIAIAASSAVDFCNASAIVCVTNTGRAARLLSHCRPSVAIYAVTTYAVVARQLHLYRGVFPLHFQAMLNTDMESKLKFAVDLGKECGYIKSGDNIVLVLGANDGDGTTNALRILTIP